MLNQCTGMQDIPVSDLIILSADLEDMPLVLEFVKGIVEYELQKAFFGERPYAEALIVEPDSVPGGFVVFSTTFRHSCENPDYIRKTYMCFPSTVAKGLELFCSRNASA